jgi:iron(III) transport system permease protein
MAALLLLAQNQRVDTLLLDAASVFQLHDWQTAWRVRLPLLSSGLLASTSLIFALTLGELGATLIVVPAGQPTLTLRIYNYLHYGASDVVAVLCLAMLVLTLACGALTVYFMAAWSHRAASPERI